MTEPASPADLPTDLPAELRERAVALDDADPLARYRDLFAPSEGLVAYLDGNSLGRPLKATRERLASFVDGPWAARLIRSWDEGWMDAPTELGDTLGRAVLGAAPGQTVVADSTTVLLYKLARAAVDARPGRRVIVADTENFPTDRFVLQGIAAERGLELRWITPDAEAGVTPEEVAAAVGQDTALVLLSHVAYKSGYIADLPAITRIVHDAGALVLWDLCHSAGAVPLDLDADGVDIAVGCTYKYLNGGPGSPAFAYLAAGVQDEVRQPVQGWMGAADPFAMGARYEPAAGIRQLISGTPPVIGMLPMRDMLVLIEEAGMPAVREKSLALTGFALEVADEYLPGVRVASPRAPELRGSHIMLDHPDFKRVVAQAWERGVVPDFRPPQGLRVGLSPLSTSFTETLTGLWLVRTLLPTR